MQFAVVESVAAGSFSSRGAIVAAFSMTLAMAVGSPAQLCGTPLTGVIAREPISATLVLAVTVDNSWQHANYLAWAIEHRRYDEIGDAADAIDSASPYARWVPAAIGLAVEQLDATAAAYGQMGRCGELGRFLRRIKTEWPAGRAAMRAVSCEGSFSCGTYKSDMIKHFGSVDAFRRVEIVLRAQRFAERTAEIDQAVVAGDHARALSTCGAIGRDGPMLSTCVAEACRAHELAIAEVLLPVADASALTACADAGVTFVDGFAYSSFAKQPAELVHVHPDAPPRLD